MGGFQWIRCVYVCVVGGGGKKILITITNINNNSKLLLEMPDILA